MRYTKSLMLFLLYFILLLSGCNLINKTMTEREYYDFTENEISEWRLIIDTQSEYRDLLIESTNEVADFYGKSYADSEIVFSYLTKIKEHQEVVRELIKVRESINPPEKYKNSNQKFLQVLKNNVLKSLEDQEKLILDRGYETLTRKDVGDLAASGLETFVYMDTVNDYIELLEDDNIRNRDDYIQKLKDEQTKNN